MKIENIIEEKNFKLTVARRELLGILHAENKPLSFEDIKDKISMDKATFYRNISKFEEEAIVNSFESNDKKRYYEMQKFPHAHFICNNCHSIECLKDIEPIKIEGYEITDSIFKGICKNCKLLENSAHNSKSV
jgi:Fur family ferric uptake transcriptional regulator